MIAPWAVAKQEGKSYISVANPGDLWHGYRADIHRDRGGEKEGEKRGKRKERGRLHL